MDSELAEHALRQILAEDSANPSRQALRRGLHPGCGHLPAGAAHDLLAIALPKVAKEIQRDREMETMHRGKQYARAIKMYYKKFGAYPPNVDALIKPTNNIRFLRKKYIDPTTGKEDWKPILFGQNKAPTAMGFFGQPIGGTGGCPANVIGRQLVHQPVVWSHIQPHDGHGSLYVGLIDHRQRRLRQSWLEFNFQHLLNFHECECNWR